MNILLSCDEKYLKYVYVLLESLFDNNTVPMHVFLIYKDTGSGKFEQLKNFVESRGDHTIEICDTGHINIETLRTNHHFPLECYYTLFPQLYLPEELDRILYLDVDTIVDREITDFYSSDFEDNHLIACGQSRGFKKTAEMAPPGTFGYFNSGVILYNLEKMRKEVPFEYYDYVLNNSEEFFFDQGMLNHLFYKDTKYEETLLYNFRSNIAFGRYFDQAVEMIKNREVFIYHYTCKGVPYKPWDFVIEDEGFFDEFVSPPITSDCFYISKEINEIMKKWWGYAEKTPLYEELYRDMTAKREYILTYKIPARINNVSQKYDSMTKKRDSLLKRVGAIADRTAKIKEIQNENGSTFLKALNRYYGFPETGNNDLLADITDINTYFKEFNKQDDHLMIISCKDNCEKYFDSFAEKTGLALNRPKMRESYVAVIYPKGEFADKRSDGEIVHRFCFETSDPLSSKSPGTDNGKSGIVVSRGYDTAKKVSISEIMVNNINYSMNLIGLNIAVVDTDSGEVIDSFNVNTHGDSELKIKRTI